MTLPPEKLIAFVDGELDAGERAEIETAAASDPALQLAIERARKLRTRLSAAFDPTLDEAPPERLTALLSQPSTVVEFPAKHRQAWTYREWGAMAASLAGGLILGLGAMNARAPTLTPTPNGLAARGALAQALDSQLAADTNAPIRIGISFESRDGNYCRTFGMARNRLAGLACKVGNEWRVPMTAAMQQASTTELQTAGSDIPAAILHAIDEQISGDALDSAAETHARDRRWSAR